MFTRLTDLARDFFSLRIPNSEFTSRPWRVHEVIDGFRVEDVWALPTPGGPDDLETLVRFAASSENTTLTSNPVIRGLFKLRWQLGERLGWDDEKQKVGKRVASLRDDLPEDLLAAERGPDMALTPFKSVFLTHDEWTAEFSAAMGHIVMHHGWVKGEDGRYYSQMTSLATGPEQWFPAFIARGPVVDIGEAHDLAITRRRREHGEHAAVDLAVALPGAGGATVVVAPPADPEQGLAKGVDA